MSHELRNPLSAIVQSSDVVLNSLRGILASPFVPTATAQEISDDIETMKSIALCTTHMRRLIDDTINVCCSCSLTSLILGFKTRKRHAAGDPSRLRPHDHRQTDTTNIRCRTPKQENRDEHCPRRIV